MKVIKWAVDLIAIIKFLIYLGKEFKPLLKEIKEDLELIKGLREEIPIKIEQFKESLQR